MTSPTQELRHGPWQSALSDVGEVDVIITDPQFAGSGTTLLAAAIEGRDSVGAEMSRATYKIARDRLSAGYTAQLFAEGGV